jgi:hypothetical protein
MKCVLAVVGALALSACTPPQFYVAGDPGNPAHSAYPGSPSSVYDSAGNPASTPAIVAYDPSAASSVPSMPVGPTAAPAR